MGWFATKLLKQVVGEYAGIGLSWSGAARAVFGERVPNVGSGHVVLVVGQDWIADGLHPVEEFPGLAFRGETLNESDRNDVDDPVFRFDESPAVVRGGRLGPGFFDGEWTQGFH